MSNKEEELYKKLIEQTDICLLACERVNMAVEKASIAALGIELILLETLEYEDYVIANMEKEMS